MKDRFSSHAKQYAEFRPTYPPELYNLIFSHVENFDFAWDAGTGNGQVATDLSPRFKKVLATDISAKQLENARPAENVLYRQMGEATDLAHGSVDLVSVAQAIHWFDREKFYTEVRRVIKPAGLLAIWGYGLITITPEIDVLVKRFYTEVVGPYWDKERKLIDEHYRTISFPFEEISTPAFRIDLKWSLKDLQGYMGTWSSVRKFISSNGVDPVDELIRNIQPIWTGNPCPISFPLFMRLGKFKR